MSHTEMLHVIDPETGDLTGHTLSRKELYAQQLWCRTTNIFILNSQGQILCHQRPLEKEHFPGAWSTHFGGHVSGDESVKASALKEIEEEIGLKLNPFQLIPWRTSRKEKSRLWVTDFITVYDGALDTLTIQEEEIKAIKWCNAKDVLEALDIEGVDGAQSWMAGTHDFYADYQCMRAVLTATLDAGIFSPDYHPLHKWNPITK